MNKNRTINRLVESQYLAQEMSNESPLENNIRYKNQIIQSLKLNRLKMVIFFKVHSKNTTKEEKRYILML